MSYVFILKMIYRLLTVFLAITLSACQTIPRRVSTFPNPEDVKKSASAQLALKRASSDLSAIRSGNTPLYAKLEAIIYDGGTRFFEGEGYQIIDHRKLSKQGMILGQTVHFDGKVAGLRPIQYSNAQFKANNESDRQ